MQPGQPEITLPDNLGEVDAAELDALEQRALTAYDEARKAGGDAPDGATVATLTGLRDVITGARGERDRRVADAAENAAKIAELDASLTPADDTTGDDAAADGDQAATDAQAAEVVAEAEQIAADGQTVTAAGARPAQRPSIGAAAGRAPKAAAPVKKVERGRGTLVAAAEAGVPMGSELTMHDGALALERAFSNLPGSEGHPRKQANVLALRKPARALVASGANDQEVLDQAGSEARLAGGSLLAAGGWCAPSETMYELAPGLETAEGLIDAPTVTWSRGGIRWTEGPQFCDFFNGEGFFTQTEAQAIAGEEKPCFEIPCPDFEEARLEAYGLCLTAGILQAKGYPEYVERFIAGSLIAHQHRINQVKIAKMVALADPVVTLTGPTGATADLLGALELQVEHRRYQWRMSPNATLEGVLPLWVRGILRSDLAKRNGVDMLAVTDEQIAAYFRLRGVRFQFVYDWQDALCATGVEPGAGLFGGAALPTAWPETVDVLLYPAGTYVIGEADIITMDALYDSTLLRTNRYQALFTEEALQVVRRAYAATLLRVPLNPSGVTGGQVVLADAEQ